MPKKRTLDPCTEATQLATRCWYRVHRARTSPTSIFATKFSRRGLELYARRWTRQACNTCRGLGKRACIRIYSTAW